MGEMTINNQLAMSCKCTGCVSINSAIGDNTSTTEYALISVSEKVTIYIKRMKE